MKIILGTQRLTLRRFVLEEVDALDALYRDPEVCRYIPDCPRTYAETRDQVAWYLHGHPRHPTLGL